MKVAARFKENAGKFGVKFTGVQTASDGGFERGYAEGYGVGKSEAQAVTRAIADGSITSFIDNEIASILQYGFAYRAKLIEVSALNVIAIGRNAFTQCSLLEKAEFPIATSIGNDCFSYCSSLEYADIGEVASLGSWVFTSCTKLKAVILRKADKITTLNATNVFSGSSVANGTGFVYVSDVLVEQYKVANNWKTYASQIKPLSELEVF